MKLLLNGAAMSALILGAAAHAQAVPPPPPTTIDTEEPAFGPAPVAAPAATGDAVLDRLNALEAKVQTLEARNKTLEEQLQDSTTRLQTVEVRAARSVQPAVSPTLSDVNGGFTFKARGVIDADFVHFNERAGGYDFNSGTGFRRARLGVEGTAFKNFAWRLEVDFAGNVVAIQDAFLQYTGFKLLTVTLGQFKAPFGLESNNSDNYNSFVERGMFTNAFGNAGAERRLGLSVAIIKDNYTFTAGAFGDNDSVGRSTTASVRSESEGFNARATWEPVNEPGKIVHVGASTFWRTSLKSGDTQNALRLTDRPNVRVDNGNIIDTGVIPNVDDMVYVGAEGTAVFGPFSVTGEYGHLHASRSAGLPSFNSHGFYVYGSWFVTGETRPFKAGNFDRIRPNSNFSDAHGTGAVELLLRYDELDVGDTPVLARVGNDAHSYTAAANWYLTPNFKLQFNYIRFYGSNTPLDPIGARTKGDALATRLHIDW